MDIMRTPKSLHLTITNRCNLRCLYCSYFSSAADVENDLPGTEWTQFFEELNRCAVMDVSLGGGEPFLRKDLRELIQSIVDNRMRYSILTNGTLINREMATYIAETKRCNNVQVSIDGSTSEVHDLCRGKGNFEKAVRGARHLLDAGVKTTVRVTIHKNNVGDLRQRYPVSPGGDEATQFFHKLCQSYGAMPTERGHRPARRRGPYPGDGKSG